VYTPGEPGRPHPCPKLTQKDNILADTILSVPKSNIVCNVPLTFYYYYLVIPRRVAVGQLSSCITAGPPLSPTVKNLEIRLIQSTSKFRLSPTVKNLEIRLTEGNSKFRLRKNCSVKRLRGRCLSVWDHNLLPHLTHRIRVYSLQERRLERQHSQSWVKSQPDLLYLQSSPSPWMSTVQCLSFCTGCST
jgi:hypothetical protein